jgi:NADH-quinone oxidoreductase subunit C
MPDEINKDQPEPSAQKPVSTQPSAAPAAPAAPAAAKLAPKPAVPASTPWTSSWVEELQKQFPGSILEAHTMLSQNVVILESKVLLDVCHFMRDTSIMPCDYLVDVTAVDYPSREKRFDVIYVLHSFQLNERVRLKIYAREDESIASVTSVWPTADWLEREVFDMFGIRFTGHPNLTRILLPEGWKGYPLRKDHPIDQMDNDWVRENLNIESGQ